MVEGMFGRIVVTWRLFGDPDWEENTLKRLKTRDSFRLGRSPGITRKNLEALINMQKVIAPLKAKEGTEFVRTSRQDQIPVELETVAGYMQWVAKKLKEVFTGLCARDIHIEAIRHTDEGVKVEGALGVEVVEIHGSKKTKRLKHLYHKKEQKNLAKTVPNPKTLENRVLELIKLTELKSHAAALVTFMRDGTPFSEKSYLLNDERQCLMDTACESGRGVLWQRKGGAFMYRSSKFIECSVIINVRFYTCEELKTLRTPTNIARFQEDPLLKPVYEQLDRLKALHEDQARKAKTGKGLLDKSEPFKTPYQLVLLGPRAGGKSSVTWAFSNILLSGWEVPTFPVREPFSRDGSTQNTEHVCFAVKSDTIDFLTPKRVSST